MQIPFEVRSFIGTHDKTWHDDGFHHHPTLEISLVLEGRGLFEWTERTRHIEASHVIIIPPGIPHRFAAVSHVRFGVIHLKGIPPRLLELTAKLAPDQGQPALATLSNLDKERFELLYREWLRLQASPLQDRSRTYTAWMEVLLLFLQEHTKSDLQAMTITKAADYIRENLRQSVQMTDLAELAGMTVAGFRRMFERVYRMSPKQYQQQCRMQEAKWLLNSTDRDVNEIASQVGFSRLHSFSQWFKAVEGVSPTMWRRKHQMKDGGHSWK
ncbi:AraC family transcriptional regulator [Paenibacillus sp. J2TS4]|uniref:helix-turn-helix domain-containing protein n=1 Tax=Paenibacillus sp. J2TS4 TaxID=2807194 RepID=UPI001B0C73A2|nr:AraC family transcriptional regulator [Paenibacillus sp. J2TS4]GIP35182.1 AraC family transcriptional regulator [Paenibacillus sp. J2TS4]